MKRVKLGGVHSKDCERCPTTIKPGDWCWRKTMRSKTVYYCDKCGGKMYI